MENIEKYYNVMAKINEEEKSFAKGINFTTKEELVNYEIKLQNLKNELMSFKADKNNFTVMESSSYEFLEIMEDAFNWLHKYYDEKIFSLKEEEYLKYLKMYFNNLQTIVKFHLIGVNKNVIIEQSNEDKKDASKNNSQYVTIPDLYNKEAEIGAIYEKEYRNIVEEEKMFYIPFNNAFLTLFGDRNEKLKNMAKMDNKIEKFSFDLLNKKINIRNINDWNNFKKMVEDLRDNYLSLAISLKYVNKLGILNAKNKEFLDYLMKCILEIENNFKDDLANNLKDIVDNMIIIVKFQELLNAEKEIIFFTKRHNEQRRVELIDGYGKVMEVGINFASQFESIAKEQKELMSDYQNAINYFALREEAKKL